MSRSSSRVEFEGGVVRWTLRVQHASLVEVLPGLDVDGDATLSRQEAAAGAEAIASYLAEHYTLRGSEDLSAVAWEGELVRVGAPLELEGMAAEELLEAAWECALEEEPAGVLVGMRLFEQTSPDHHDFFECHREGRLSYSAPFSAARPGAWVSFATEAEMSFLQWVQMGARHILTGYDHLAFLLALLVCVRGLKQTAWVVTAFTAAHSITLALSALELVTIPARFVELVIALSISFVALGGFAREPRRGLWLESLLFGLVHGLGFASFLGDALLMESRRAPALVGFNLGVELGQLLFLLPIALLLHLRKRRAPCEGGWWVPAVPRKITAGVVAAAGAFWFLERSGWLS